jgi:hypothetical protein
LKNKIATVPPTLQGELARERIILSVIAPAAGWAGFVEAGGGMVHS